LIPANERRFGTPDNPREPEDHEAAGAPSQSPFYDTQERDRAVYDQGGAPLPGAVLDYNTGRAYDRDNGVQLVEPTFGTPQPGQNANPNPHPGPDNEGFVSTSADGDDIDDDIVEQVLNLNLADLEKKLAEEDLEVPEKEDISELKVDELRQRLNDEEVGFNPEDKKADLHRKLAAKLTRNRKEVMQDRLAVHLQDKRDSEQGR
jgi:hypothetical protein